MNYHFMLTQHKPSLTTGRIQSSHNCTTSQIVVRKPPISHSNNAGRAQSTIFSLNNCSTYI